MNVSQIRPAALDRAAAVSSPEEKLKKVAQQMEGVFVEQLFKAMRETVPQGEGVVDGGMGEEMFTSMMDQHLAPLTAEGWGRGIGDALYRQLRGSIASPSSNGEGGS